MSAGDGAFRRCTYLTGPLIPQAEDFHLSSVIAVRRVRTFSLREDECTTLHHGIVEFWIVIGPKVVIHFLKQQL